jgi:hypothetical protein
MSNLNIVVSNLTKKNIVGSLMQRTASCVENKIKVEKIKKMSKIKFDAMTNNYHFETVYNIKFWGLNPYLKGLFRGQHFGV